MTLLDEGEVPSIERYREAFGFTPRDMSDDDLVHYVLAEQDRYALAHVLYMIFKEGEMVPWLVDIEGRHGDFFSQVEFLSELDARERAEYYTEPEEDNPLERALWRALVPEHKEALPLSELLLCFST